MKTFDRLYYAAAIILTLITVINFFPFFFPERFLQFLGF